jgi:hypothetical protein
MLQPGAGHGVRCVRTQGDVNLANQASVFRGPPPQRGAPFKGFLLADSRSASLRPLPSCRSLRPRCRNTASNRPRCRWWVAPLPDTLAKPDDSRRPQAFPPAPPLWPDPPSEDRVPDRPTSRSRCGRHRGPFTGLPRHLDTDVMPYRTSPRSPPLPPALLRTSPRRRPPHRSVAGLRSRSFAPRSRAFALDSHAPSVPVESRRPSVRRSHITASCAAGPVDFRALLRRRVRDDGCRCQQAIIRSFLGFALPFEAHLPSAAGLTLPKKSPDPAPWPKPGCVCPVGGLAASPK